MKRLRVAVVGAGHLGRIHARLLKSIEAVELVGVVDPVAAARNKTADEFGTASYAHLYEVLGKIDAAIVAAPTSLHHDVALELLRSGVHCLVEKPICSTTAQAENLIAAARAQRLVLQVGHVERFNPVLAEIGDSAGDVRYLEATRTSGYTFRSTDIGVVLDLMIHDIDLALSLSGGNVTSVQATGMTVVGPHEDIAQARLTFDNGCVANLWASRASPTAQRTFNVYSDRLHASLDLTAKTARLLRPREELLRGEIDVQCLAPAEQQRLKENQFSELLPVETIQVAERNAILDEQHDFVRGILEGRPVRVPGEAGRDALAVAETILRKIGEQQAVDFDIAASQPESAVRFPRLAA